MRLTEASHPFPSETTMTRRPLFLLALACCTLHAPAQSSKKPAPPRTRAISFVSPTPALGLPAGLTHTTGVCSADGLSFFDTSADTDTPSDLYTVSMTAEVKHLRRKLPLSYTALTVLSFYPADHTLVTLLKAEKRDDPKSSPTTTDYFLSLSDHDGDQADLLELRLPFRPLRVAAFGSGDYLAVGWEPANQLPVMAVLKSDGTIRRFVDLGDLQRSDAKAAKNLELLNAAAFVPFGNSVLLTFPGSNRPAQLASPNGTGGSIPLFIPSGYVLHDVLNFGGQNPLVMRVEPLPQPPDDKGKIPKPGPMRVFEVNSYTGALREFTFTEAPPASVTCAAKSSLIAVYLSPVGTPAKAITSAAEPPAEIPMQMVVGSIRR